MTPAVLASLGPLFAWTLLLVVGSDPRARGTLWVMVLLALVGLALVALWINPPGTFPEHVSLTWLTATLIMGAFAWGQRQARRWPARGPTGLPIAAAVMGLVALGVLASEAAAMPSTGDRRARRSRATATREAPRSG